MNSAATRPGPFELHLREAIELNTERAPLYAAASDGASLPVSRTLIRLERLLLPIARWFDRRAQPFHAAGIPLLHDAFVSMAETPRFVARVAPPSAPPALRPRGGGIARDVRRALRRSGPAGAAARIQRELDTLAREPHFHGMLRHTLESTARIALLSPAHAGLARERNLPSPERLHTHLILLHTLGFAAAARLDRRAAPLQLRGVPIVIRDVPPVPPPPDRAAHG